MNSLLDDHDELDHDDRELTLSTASILGIFFGLVLLCGLFFGFGYKVGSHKAAAPAATTATDTTPSSSTDFSSFKPAGSSSSTKPTAGTSTNTAPSPAVSAASTAPTAPPPSSPPAASNATPAPANPHATPPAPVHPPAAPTTPADTTPTPTPVSLGTGFVVQIAAISVTHQGDADLLVSALKSKGYAVSAHAEPDHFIHVQVGPYANRKDAEAMRNRLSADGYQPFIK